MPRRWHQLGDGASHHAGDGGKKARSPGRARKKPLKPFAQGMPESSGEPVVTTRVFSFTRNRGCVSGARHSLRPLIFRADVFSDHSEAICLAGMYKCVIARNVRTLFSVMPGLVPAIHDFVSRSTGEDG